MNPLRIASALTLSAALIGLAPVLHAQGEEEYDAFGIEGDDAPLDELLPDDGGAAPLPADAAGDSPVAAEAPAAPAPSGNEIAAVAPPAGWQPFALGRFSAHAPAGFETVAESDDQVMFFAGDQSVTPPRGTMMGMVLERVDNFLPPGARISVEREVTIGGMAFLWRELEAEMEPGVVAQMILLTSKEPVDRRDHLLIHGTAVGEPIETHRAEIETMIATLRIAGAAAPAMVEDTALGGLVSYSVPGGWNVMQSPDGDQVSFWPPVYSGYVSVSRGAAVNGPDGLLSQIPAGTEAQSAMILDQVADLYFWAGSEAEFQSGAQMVPGHYNHYHLLRCAGGEAVLVTLAGIPEVIHAPEFAAVLDGLKLDMPQETGDCTGAVAAPAAAPEPAVSEAAPQPEAPATGLPVEVEGVTWLVPGDWLPLYDSPDDKSFESPDHSWRVLGFWWFPDEPLLGYDDIARVENIVVDHEPVTRIHSDHGAFRVIKTVTERARDDGQRFIFTVEGDDKTEAEIQAMTDALTANLHLQGGFDPAKRVDPLAGAAPPPVAAPAAATGPDVAGGVIDFDKGIQGWTGDHADLTAQPSGGPEGRGVVEAFTPGDGVNGYLIAPPGMLGDWRGAAGLRITLRTHAGDYVGAFDYGGLGDIYIASGGRTAGIAYDRQVGEDWIVQEVRFDAPGWSLGGGAASVEEILADVTDLRIRMEFLIGDATAWIAKVEVLPGDGAPAPAPVAAPGEALWETYVNPRFGTRLDWPAGLLTPQPPPANGDGQGFASADGTVSLAVFGQMAFDGTDPRTLMARDIGWGSYDQVTYQAAGADWYAFSGFAGEAIFYRKAMVDLRNEVIHTFEITYPASARETWDPMVARLAKSLGFE